MMKTKWQSFVPVTRYCQWILKLATPVPSWCFFLGGSCHSFMYISSYDNSEVEIWHFQFYLLQDDCIHVYMDPHTHIHTYVRTYVRTYIHTSIHPSIHTCIHTYIQTDRQTYIYIYIYIYTCFNLYVCSCFCNLNPCVSYVTFHSLRSVDFGRIVHEGHAPAPNQRVAGGAAMQDAASIGKQVTCT